MNPSNMVVLLGHLGADPELSYTSNNNARVAMSVATNKNYGDNKPDWHNVVAFGATGEAMFKGLSTGSPVYILGHIAYSSYESDGVRHRSMNIVVDMFRFLESKQAKEERQSQVAATSGPSEANNDIPFGTRDLLDPSTVEDDDIPF